MSRQIEEPRRTRRASDVTGHENLLLLLPAPGDEIALGGLIAELCARGRPPFVAILGDGAPDGAAADARAAALASRDALDRLGLPDERRLFVGLRQGCLPRPDTALFAPLKTAMTLLSWRKDCNVIGGLYDDRSGGDRSAAWRVAQTIAGESRLGLVGRVDAATIATGCAWDLDVEAWRDAKMGANRADGHRPVVSADLYERYVRAL